MDKLVGHGTEKKDVRTKIGKNAQRTVLMSLFAFCFRASMATMAAMALFY